MQGFENTYLPEKYWLTPRNAILGFIAAFSLAAVCLAFAVPAIAQKQKNSNKTDITEEVEETKIKNKQKRKDEKSDKLTVPKDGSEQEEKLGNSEDILDPLKTRLVINVRSGNEKGSAVKGARVRVKCGNDIEFSHSTDSEGRAVIKDVLRGKVEIWVTASTWTTKFESYTLSQKDEEVNILLEKPSH